MRDKRSPAALANADRATDVKTIAAVSDKAKPIAAVTVYQPATSGPACSGLPRVSSRKAALPVLARHFDQDMPIASYSPDIPAEERLKPSPLEEVTIKAPPQYAACDKRYPPRISRIPTTGKRCPRCGGRAPKNAALGRAVCSRCGPFPKGNENVK